MLMFGVVGCPGVQPIGVCVWGGGGGARCHDLDRLKKVISDLDVTCCTTFVRFIYIGNIFYMHPCNHKTILYLFLKFL